MLVMRKHNYIQMLHPQTLKRIGSPQSRKTNRVRMNWQEPTEASEGNLRHLESVHFQFYKGAYYPKKLKVCSFSY